MSPHRTRRGGPVVPPWPSGAQRAESWPDGAWVVRPVTGAAATKPYRCPGCDQVILPGVPHLVVWPADSRGVEDRRHWHRVCWQQRLRRRAGR